MVNHSEGQFYTMEGIGAAILMVLTAYIVFNSTTLYTPGDSHINDMQLEQIGNDALKIIDTNNNYTDRNSTLERYVLENNSNQFTYDYFILLNSRSSRVNVINFKADIFYINDTEVVKSVSFGESSILFNPSDSLLKLARKFSGNENAVRISRWVFVGNNCEFAIDCAASRNQTILLEVLLWRE